LTPFSFNFLSNLLIIQIISKYFIKTYIIELINDFIQFKIIIIYYMINKIFLFLLIVFKQIFTAIFKMIQIKEDYALKKSKVLIFEKFSSFL